MRDINPNVFEILGRCSVNTEHSGGRCRNLGNDLVEIGRIWLVTTNRAYQRTVFYGSVNPVADLQANYILLHTWQHKSSTQQRRVIIYGSSSHLGNFLLIRI